jgi:hypothetical protein
MEISPAIGLRIAPVIRSTVTDLGLTDIYEVERSSRAGDETYTPSGAKAAAGFEDDDGRFDDAEDEVSMEGSVTPPAHNSVNILA